MVGVTANHFACNGRMQTTLRCMCMAMCMDMGSHVSFPEYPLRVFHIVVF